LGSAYLIPAALARDAALRDAVLANPDVRRALGLVKDLSEGFPDESPEWSWALLRWSEPEAAARLTEVVRRDEASRLQRQIDDKVSPLNGTTAYRLAWALEIERKAGEADAVLRRCAARGVPLPLAAK
jgi:hypothetical protein